MAGRMVCRLCPGWEKELAQEGREEVPEPGEGVAGHPGVILAPCLGVLTPFPEAGGSEDKGVHLGGTDLGVMGHTYTGGKSGLGWIQGQQRVRATRGPAGSDGDLNTGWGLHHHVSGGRGRRTGDQHIAATGQKFQSSQEGGQQGLGGHGHGCGSINLEEVTARPCGLGVRRMA